MDSKSVLDEGRRRAITDGRATLFWIDRWALPQPLAAIATTNIPEDWLERTVESYWDPTQGWLLDDLGSILPLVAIQAIYSIEILQDIEGVDCNYWGPSEHGRFTIKSAIQLIRKDVPCEDKEIWDVIWKAKVPQKARIFMWLAAHGRLMTNTIRFRRRFVDSDKCTICGDDGEDSLHILRFCDEILFIWEFFKGLGLGQFNPHSSIRDWIVANLLDTKKDARWPMMLSLTAWWAWKWRCAACFGNIDMIPTDKIRFLQGQFHEVGRALSTAVVHLHGLTGSLSPQMIGWSAPPEGWIMLNTDGSTRGNLGLAGFGGIFRNNRGEWLGGFAGSLGCSATIHAEIKAVLEGLKLAWTRGYLKLWVQSDSLDTVNILRGDMISYVQYKPMSDRCKSYLRDRRWEVRVSHCYREANQAADALSKIGTTVDSNLVILDTPPASLVVVLEEDHVGATWPRLI